MTTRSGKKTTWGLNRIPESRHFVSGNPLWGKRWRGSAVWPHAQIKCNSNGEERRHGSQSYCCFAMLPNNQLKVDRLGCVEHHGGNATRRAIQAARAARANVTPVMNLAKSSSLLSRIDSCSSDDGRVWIYVCSSPIPSFAHQINCIASLPPIFPVKNHPIRLWAGYNHVREDSRLLC